MSRRQRHVAVRSPVPLFVLAGLPAPVHNTVRNYLEQRWPRARYITTAFPSAGAPLYSERNVKQLFKASAGFIVRRRRAEQSEVEVAPSNVFLIYIMSGDDERLLRAFDFFTFPVGVSGQTWRLRPQRAEQFIESVVKDILSGRRNATEIRREVVDRLTRSVLTLPPNNFLTGKQRTLAEELRQIRSRMVGLDDLQRSVKPKKFLHDDLPKALGDKTRDYFYQDARGLVFPPPLQNEFHGSGGPLDDNATDEEIRLKLNELYRFGMPLKAGFHADVQYPGGRQLRRQQFTCSRRGPIEISDSHARVYPNDCVVGRVAGD